MRLELVRGRSVSSAASDEIPVWYYGLVVYYVVLTCGCMYRQPVFPCIAPYIWSENMEHDLISPVALPMGLFLHRLQHQSQHNLHVAQRGNLNNTTLRLEDTARLAATGNQCAAHRCIAFSYLAVPPDHHSRAVRGSFRFIALCINCHYAMASRLPSQTDQHPCRQSRWTVSMYCCLCCLPRQPQGIHAACCTCTGYVDM